MAESGSGRSGGALWGAIAGIVVLAVAGGVYLFGTNTEAPQTTAPQDEVADQAPQENTEDVTVSEDAAETPDTASTSDTETAAAEPEPPKAPALDQIFVEPDGNAVLSGSAEPGSQVNVLLDGEPVHRFTVDPSGKFAEFISIPFANAARGLTLETHGEDPVRSDDYVIAALPEPEPEVEPTPPIETAEAQPEPAQDTPVEAEEGAPQDETAEAAAEEAQAPSTGAEETPAPDVVASAEPEAAQEEESASTGQNVAVLRSGEDGVELVQAPTAQPQDPEEVALDTIGYSDTGDVELTGRVPGGSVVRLYLDNKLVADLTPAEDGKWRGELDGVDPGVYTLRVDEVGVDGTVVSRLETPFKREPVEVLRAAEAPAETDQVSDAPPPIRSVTVQEGDTLWAISRDRFGDGVLYVRLFEANRDAIRDPDLIYPGQVFTIPE